MNIYKVSRKDDGGYDSFDSFIVVAKSIESARKTHPRGGKVKKKEDWYGGWVELEKINDLEVHLIGAAIESIKTEGEIILASFNAG